MTEAQIVALFEEVSNRGRWGAEDERGTLNFLIPAKVLEAAALVRSGRVVSLAHDLNLEKIPKDQNPAKLTVFGPTAPNFGAGDELQVRPHSLVNTHLDALTHISWRGKFYNDKPVDDAVKDGRVVFAGIHAQKDGVVTRGVLLDIAKARGVEYLPYDDSGVTPADLDAAERLAGTKVRSGDALMVRTGARLRSARLGPEDASHTNGLLPECARWLHQREIAIFGSDASELAPTPYPGLLHVPFHQAVIPTMGLILIDHVAVEPLVVACAEERRNEFLFTVAALRIPGATGSNVNPLAVF